MSAKSIPTRLREAATSPNALDARGWLGTLLRDAADRIEQFEAEQAAKEFDGGYCHVDVSGTLHCKPYLPSCALADGCPLEALEEIQKRT